MSNVVILALAYGSEPKINQPLKDQIEELLIEHPSWTVFTQRDLGTLLNLGNSKLIIAPQEESSYISTLGVINKFSTWVKLAGGLGVNEVYLVAARQQIGRCRRDVKHLLPRAKIHIKRVYVPYMVDVRSWVQSPLRWWTRELVIRLLPWPLYKWLCS